MTSIRLQVFAALVSLIGAVTTSSAYKDETHRELTRGALEQSALRSTPATLRALGRGSYVEERLFGQSIEALIAAGAKNEDSFPTELTPSPVSPNLN